MNLSTEEPSVPPLAPPGVSLLQTEPAISLELDDFRNERWYYRLAALFRSFGIVILAFLVAWIITSVSDVEASARWLELLVGATVIAAIALLIRAELSLRTMTLEVTGDYLIYNQGKRRTYVPAGRIQLLDEESGWLLRLFDLRRLSLHTAGGLVLVPPIPATVAGRVRQLLLDGAVPDGSVRQSVQRA